MAFVSSLSLPARARVPVAAKVKIQEEIKKAEEATSKFGRNSKEAALAWDVVEELEAEASHMKVAKGKVDPLDEYCEDSPEADECRVYDN